MSDVDERETGGPPLVGLISVYSTIPILCVDPLVGDDCRVEFDIRADTQLRVTQRSSAQSGSPPCTLA